MAKAEISDQATVFGERLNHYRRFVVVAVHLALIVVSNYVAFLLMFRGSIPARLNGVLVSTEMGRTTAYALDNLQERGSLFVGAGEQVYEGQVVGEHCRDNDLPVNVCREKKLTNVRASTAEKTILLKPPRQLPLELALEYIAYNTTVLMEKMKQVRIL